jgi:hypothetical protein
MPTAISDRSKSVRAGLVHGQGLRLVPILGPSLKDPAYRVFDAAAMPFVKISEVSESGSVQQLQVENTLEQSVFLMDGQELVGAKQNRILNTDVMVAARTRLPIPVSCVEARRWRYTSDSFAAGKSASSRTRSAKMERVHTSLKRGGHHDADQTAVWSEVEQTLRSSNSSSMTSALQDAYTTRKDDLSKFRNGFSLPEDAVGLAVFHSERLCGLDLFDRHESLKHFFETLADSYAIDWLGRPEPAVVESPAAADQEIGTALQTAAAGQWGSFASPGEGEDYRLENERYSGSALVWKGLVVHMQLFPKIAGK